MIRGCDWLRGLIRKARERREHLQSAAIEGVIEKGKS